jgi:hypothetical protein
MREYSEALLIVADSLCVGVYSVLQLYKLFFAHALQDIRVACDIFRQFN